MNEQFKKAEFYFHYPFLLPAKYDLSDLEPEDEIVNVFADMPEGWAKGFLIDMCEKIRNELIEFNALYSYKVYGISYFKTSFKWDDFGRPRGSRIGEIVKHYQNVAKRTCTVCGQEATRIQNSPAGRQLCNACWQSEYGLDSDRIWKDEEDKDFNKTIFELSKRPFLYIDEWHEKFDTDIYDRLTKNIDFPNSDRFFVNNKYIFIYILFSVVNVMLISFVYLLLDNYVKLVPLAALFIAWVLGMFANFLFCKTIIFESDDDILEEAKKFILSCGIMLFISQIPLIFNLIRANFKLSYLFICILIEHIILFFVNKFFVFR